MTRLATTEWQRLPVGVPFNLEAGKHLLSVRIRNAFAQGQADRRTLYLAKYELLRLDQGAAQPPALAAGAPAPMMMQPAAAATMQAQASPAPMMQQAATTPAMALPASPMQNIPLPGVFHVVFGDALEGQTIAGPVHIHALSWWPDREHTPPPLVDLLVNDKVVASETNDRCDFRLAVAAFQAGENKIQLRATLPNGQQALSPVESVTLPKELNPDGEPYQRSYRYYACDPAWDAGMQARLHPGDPEGSAGFYVNGDSSLKLPDDLRGRFQIAIEARSQDYQGPAVATVLLKVGTGPEAKLAEVPADNKMGEKPVAPVTFAPGPKTLIVRYANDAFKQGEGDRNLFVRSIRLEPVVAPMKTELPTAGILYPANGARVGWADAVVANISAREGIAEADLLIDGKPQNLSVAVARSRARSAPGAGQREKLLRQSRAVGQGHDRRHRPGRGRRRHVCPGALSFEPVRLRTRTARARGHSDHGAAGVAGGANQ
jgi:hypothetical protein